MEELNEQQLNEFQKIFSFLDLNGDGVITKREFYEAMKSLGSHPTKHEVNNVVKKMDIDGDGQINFDELLNYVKKVYAAFKNFDLDGSGYISTEELRDVMNNLGFSLSDEEIQDMINDIDIDGDGQIHFNEFLVKMMLTQ
jgi:Ca2+-binding EF-hand superfamily protein